MHLYDNNPSVQNSYISPITQLEYHTIYLFLMPYILNILPKRFNFTHLLLTKGSLQLMISIKASSR